MHTYGKYDHWKTNRRDVDTLPEKVESFDTSSVEVFSFLPPIVEYLIVSDLILSDKSTPDSLNKAELT